MGFLTLLVLVLLLGGRWPRWRQRLTWVCVAGLVLLAMPAVSDPMLIALERGLPTTPPADDPPKAIVVLGGDLIRTDQDPLGVRPGLLTLDRERTAAALQRATGLPILVTGGIVQPNLAPVGVVMQHSMADDFRTPVHWTEAASANTQQNAQFSAHILRADGIDSVYVVTHSWHMRRAVLAFQRAGLKVTAAPTDPDEPLGYTLEDFVPRTGAWQTCWFALHEWVGYAWYWLRPHL